VTNFFKTGYLLISLLKINIIRNLLLLVFLHTTLQIIGQRQIGPDSVFSVKASPFFKELMSKSTRSLSIKSSSLSLISSFDPLVFKMSGGEFIKVKDKLYFHFYNSGRIFKHRPENSTEDSLQFVRLDATVNLNYNIGSLVFSVGESIYEYGGYGFWKSNGTLRGYNFRDREWDVVALDQEIHMPPSISSGPAVWIDPKESFLYVPYQLVVNDGLSRDSDKPLYLLESYRLNLKKFSWEFLGRVSQSTKDLLKSTSQVFTTEKGLLASYTSRIYWLDFESNSIKLLVDPSLTQTLLRIQNYMLWYWDRQQLFWYNPTNGRYDSLFIDAARFKPYANEIWQKPLAISDYSWMLLLTIALFVVTFLNYNKKKNQLRGVNQDNIQEAKHPFITAELSLLELLIVKQRENQTVTIPEINYVLGLKDKNQGMQKKVRSDIIKRINEKYCFLSQEKVSLIQNIRNETDKRFFEYHLNPDHLERLRTLLS
jgi:hypothetical protein